MQKSLVERDKQVIWHPYTQARLAPDPLPIAKGQGVYLEDAAGNRYIDAISSWWVNLHGHAHPYLASRIYEQAMQLEQVIFAGFTHEPAVQLAERLLKVLPGGMSKVFFSDNGSTAVEVALKMAIQYWRNLGASPQRKKILAFTNSYHGDTFGSMSVSGRGPFTLAFDDYLFEALFIDPPGETSDVKRQNAEGARSQVEAHWDEIACFIYEPLVQGAGGMLMHSPAGLNALLKKCKEHNIICIADEVMTGFGRTGKLFASDHMEEKPDIICLSKGLTGGMMALGATVCTQQVYEAFLSEDKMKTLFHGHSYTANPLACTAGNASLDLLLEDNCRQNIDMISEMHTSATLRKSISSLKFIHNLRSRGTILAFEVETSGKAGYLNNISAAIHGAALKKGVLIRPLGNTVYVMPPYCITNDELQAVYDCILSVVEEVEG